MGGQKLGKKVKTQRMPKGKKEGHKERRRPKWKKVEKRKDEKKDKQRRSKWGKEEQGRKVWRCKKIYTFFPPYLPRP